jgi:NAD(P)-dependent dehydrogenase (short-subunit alcohol dehydrogenase family)
MAYDTRGIIMTEQSVLITGAATGIGMALAQRLDREGWKVFAGINRSTPEALIENSSDRLVVMPIDVTDRDQIRGALAIVEQALEQRGLDLLIHNAAMTGAPGPLEFIDIDQFKFLMDVNFWGPLQITQTFLPLLRQSNAARIINVTSTSVYLTIPLGGAYPISKSAYRALSNHMRMELAPFGIDVTALEPGGVKTRMTGFEAEEERLCWQTIPEGMREEYQRRFEFPSAGLSEGFEFESADSFADKVYRQIVCARKLKPVYVIGKGVAFMPWMHRLLPLTMLEKFFRKLFRVKV